MKRLIYCLLPFASLSLAQGITSRPPDAQGVSATLRDLARATAAGEGEKTEREIPNKLYIPRPTGPAARAKITRNAVVAPNSATVTQTTNGTLPMTVVNNFLGLGRGFGLTQGGPATFADQFIVPPDTTLAVGPTQLLQWVNVKLTILDKSTGASLLPGAGYVDGSQVWNGLPSGSVCRDTNQGDPVAQYDRAAGRWVLSQFAFGVNTSANPIAPFAICMAVSTTSDATGTYYLYEYTYPELPDYPKLGVWPDGYYMTTNQFTINPTTGASAFVGAQACAFDRAAMLAGNSATQICTPKMTNRFALLPADIEGNIAPPPGTPNYIISTDWFFLIAAPYSFRLQKFKVDFVTPANTTFDDGFGGGANSFVQLPTSGVLGACGDSGGACVAQPATARVLDTLSMRPMYRLAYRNLGAGRENLYVTDTVDPSGTAQAGVRWVEIRNPAANPPVIYHNSIFNPDGTNRWMGAVASDKLGNMALGYSVSSSAVFPGIRVAGRLRNDLRNQLRGEISVATGAGSQTSTAQRWGDYSTMQIDPGDDCTFWYTQQYMTSTQTRDWSTRIVGFKFPSCQ